MRIAELKTQPIWILTLGADDGRIGHFDLSPYLQYDTFAALQDQSEFAKVITGGYFIE